MHSFSATALLCSTSKTDQPGHLLSLPAAHACALLIDRVAAEDALRLMRTQLRSSLSVCVHVPTSAYTF
jgi:hypothetical protein